MGADTKIQWTGTPIADGNMLPGYTFNPWIGCTEDEDEPGEMSPECKNCYAREGQNHRVSKAKSLPLWGPEAYRQVTSASYWKQPLKWNREAKESGIRRKVFCASQADVFEDFQGALTGDPRCWGDLDDVREALWRLIEQTPHLDWLLLTKRPQNVRRMVPGEWIHNQGCIVRDQGGCGGACFGAWPNHVWMGTTAGTRKGAARRIPELLRIPAWLHFVSGEPLLELVDYRPWFRPRLPGDAPGWRRAVQTGAGPLHGAIDWLILGGESEARSHKARTFDLTWAREAIAQCKAAGVPVFFKQAGSRPCQSPRSGGSTGYWLTLADKKGGDLSELPEDLRVREFPLIHREGCA